MRRVRWLLPLVLLVPQASSAIQLQWNSGSAELTFSAATRCTLVVQADSAEVRLPAEWHLLWVADSSSIQFVAADPWVACQTDTAQGSRIDGPATPADSTANLVTEHFCSGGVTAASTAQYVLDLPAGGRGKLKVVALDPNDPDSSAVIESNQAVYNGGVDGPYAPAILGVSRSHHLGHLSITVEGTGLATTQGLSIVAPDTSWRFPLNVVSRSDSRVTAEATLAAPLPPCVVEATTEGAAIAATSLPADSFPPVSPQSCFSDFSGAQDTTGMQPKDFAFIDAGDTWHIFYTRQYQTSNYTDRTNTRAIGHATSTDQHLSSWTVVDRSAIHVREGRIWDNLHVWAPSIVLQGVTYYMFYTGVQLDTIQKTPQLITSEIQRIGVATSTDLNTWTQDATPVYFNKMVPWTFQDSTLHSIDSWQFRDAFVMPDPEQPGHWLMYFATIDSSLNKYVIGVAASGGTDVRTWQNKWPLRRTSASFMNADRDESPHAFFHHGNWWLMYTSNHFYGDQITYSLNATSATDSSTWSRPDSLKAITCGEHGFPTSLNQWHGTEYVGTGLNEYLSAFSDALSGGGLIQFTQLKPPDATCPSDSLRLDCPDVWTGVEPGATAPVIAPLTLTLAGACPVHSTARLHLVLEARMQVHLAIYDVFGRRVKTLTDGMLPAGSTTLSWDGRAEQGSVVSSGVYFARATYGGGRRVLRIPLVH